MRENKEIIVESENKKVSNLVESIKKLNLVLIEENKALENYDIDKVRDLFEEKQKLANVYKTLVTTFMNKPKLVEELDLETKEVIKLESLKLNDAVSENSHLIKAKMKANKMLLDAVVNAAKQKKSDESSAYGSQGSMNFGSHNSNALNFNQVL